MNSDVVPVRCYWCGCLVSDKDFYKHSLTCAKRHEQAREEAKKYFCQACGAPNGSCDMDCPNSNSGKMPTYWDALGEHDSGCPSRSKGKDFPPPIFEPVEKYIAETVHNVSKEKKNLNLSRPNVSHYLGDIEPIDVIRAWSKHWGEDSFEAGNVIKYIRRYPIKGDPWKDLQKARDYIDFLIEKHEGEARIDGRCLRCSNLGGHEEWCSLNKKPSPSKEKS